MLVGNRSVPWEGLATCCQPDSARRIADAKYLQLSYRSDGGAESCPIPRQCHKPDRLPAKPNVRINVCQNLAIGRVFRPDLESPGSRPARDLADRRTLASQLH